MVRKRISSEFRARLSEKLMDLGNLTIAGLALGQFFTSKEFSGELFFAGILLAVLCYIISFVVDS